MELTKNADKFVCCAYKYYLEQMKASASMFNAKRIPFEVSCTFKPLKDFSHDDIREIIAEAARAGFGSMTMECNFFINDKMIVYMENRFKNGLTDVIDTISKFIP